MYFYIISGISIICLTYLITLCIKSCDEEDKRRRIWCESQLITSDKLNKDGYKIYKLKTLIEYVGECNIKNKLLNLDFIPAYSNYSIAIHHSGRDIIVQVNNDFQPSRTLFKTHLNLNGVYDSCCLALSHKQMEYLDLIQKKDIDVQTDKND